MTVRLGLARRKGILRIMSLALTICGVTDGSARGNSTSDVKVVDIATNAAKLGDCETALRLIPVALKSSSLLSSEQNAQILNLATSCALNLHQPKLAYQYAVDGTKFQESTDWLWRIRLALELDAMDSHAALMTVTAMTQGRGAALNSVPVKWMYQLNRNLRDAGDTVGQRQLLTMLVDNSYQPDEPLPVKDVFRQRFAELLYDKGEHAAALAMVREIDTPPIVMSLSVDFRFRAAVPTSYDARAAMTAYLERLQQIALEHPDSLGAIIEVSAIQRNLGRSKQALATLYANDPTMANAHAYADKADKLNWWWDAVARAYEAAGDYEHTVAAMRKGMDVGENGDTNVSQTINLAEAQLRYGHPNDALETLAVFGKAKMSQSPYGEMEMRFARGCATKLAGKIDAADDIRFVKEHSSDNREALGSLLVCVGNLDDAAAAFIARLDDPAQRADALLELSEFAAPPMAVPVDPIYSKIPGLKAREDMQAAISRAGGTRTFNVQRLDM